jgi:hypothetical protein
METGASPVMLRLVTGLKEIFWINAIKLQIKVFLLASC